MSRHIIHMKKNVRVWQADNSNSNKIYITSEKDHENHSVINNTPVSAFIPITVNVISLLIKY